MSACSIRSASLAEPLHATAPFAPTWLLIEERGAWGRKAVREAGFGELEEHAKEHGVRVGLVRRSWRRGGEGPPRVFVARCTEPSVEELAGVDPFMLDPARLPRGEAVSGPLYLVCTNGRRDVCCGRAGAAVARALDRERREQLWETTHVGGHRFAANLVALPHGLVFGRLDATSAGRVVAAYEQGRIDLRHFRGRTSSSPEEQAREHFVREREGLVGVDDELGGYRVEVRAEQLEPARPTSCGGEPERPVSWRLVSLAASDTATG